MKKYPKRSLGFMMIEALVALVIVSLGILALARLESLVVGSAGNAKARSAATALARSTMESVRNNILQSQYTANMVAIPETIYTKDGIQFRVSSTVSQPDASLNNWQVHVTVAWTSPAGAAQTVNMNSLVAWNNPANAAMTQKNISSSLIAPTGAAQRGVGSYSPGQSVSVQDGSTQSDKITRLLNSSGETILYLAPDSSGNAQQFTVIYGRVYFDQSVNSNQLPAADNVYVRLSSEGQCVYDHASANLQILPSGATGNSIKYKYFSYRCYVGPGWYGSVGVSSINDVAPTVCVGDPNFTDDGTTVSAAAVEWATRSYRGFRAQTSGGTTQYISTGMRGGGIYGNDGTSATKDGSPKPSAYSSTYGISSGSSSDYFNQDFLVSNITGHMTCANQMKLITSSNTFSPNAGKYYCIAPDDHTSDSDQCPGIWPGFSSSTCSVTITGSQLGSGATVSCTVTDGSSCSCQTQTGTLNYSCSTTGGSTQTATVTAALTSSSFGAWQDQTCLPSSSCVAPSDTTTTGYQCAQSTCSSGDQRVQSRTITTGAWSNTACTSPSLCAASKPADTSSTQYQCAQSSCYSGENIVQSRTVTTNTTTTTVSDNTVTTNNVGTQSNGVTTQCSKNAPGAVLPSPNPSTSTSTSGNQTTTVTTTWSNGGWSTSTTYGASCGASCGTGGKVTWCPTATQSVRTLVTTSSTSTSYGSWTDYSTPSCSSSCTAPSGVSGVNYQCASSTCTGQKKIVQHQTATYGSWTDTSPTCVSTSATLPTSTSSLQYQWSTTGCSSGTEKLQARSSTSSSTQTCHRTSSALGCSNLSGFNIDATTATCSTQ